jgi:magnesium chelatase subunit I
MKDKRNVYPFSAIVGQDEMKKGLILNAINPKLSGILIRGEKGTAKSTAVRALADVLPEINVVKDCPFSCDPDDIANMCPKCRECLKKGEVLPVVKRKMRVVDLPISATEDKVVGTLDIEKAIKKGEKHFEPVICNASDSILWSLSNVDMKIVAKCQTYIVYGGTENFIRMIYYVCSKVLGLNFQYFFLMNLQVVLI